MKRWIPWLLLPLLLAGWTVASHSKSPLLLQDTDTKVLLQVIRERQDPLSWFTGDWPLQNHFYRPVSTLVFELDNALHADNPAGYGLTNAVLAAICVLLLFWVWREITDSPWFTAAATTLFGLWHVFTAPLAWIATALAWASGLVWLALFRDTARPALKAKILPVAVASLASSYLAALLTTPADIRWRVVDWIPGRTASVMTIFCLVAIAAYARYERLTAKPLPDPDPTPLDLPATKGTVLAEPGRAPWVWLALAFPATALALAAYEQAVMLPAVLLGVAIFFRATRRRPHWLPHIGFWAILAGYLVLRATLVPTEVSGYQAQQLRSGSGALLSLVEILFPAGNRIFAASLSLDLGLVLFLTSTPYLALWALAANLATYNALFRSPGRWLPLFALVAGFVAFLPMAFLNYFGHYMYWPAALNSAYLVGLAALVARLLAIAIAPPTLQAPARDSATTSPARQNK